MRQLGVFSQEAGRDRLLQRRLMPDPPGSVDITVALGRGQLEGLARLAATNPFGGRVVVHDARIRVERRTRPGGGVAFYWTILGREIASDLPVGLVGASTMQAALAYVRPDWPGRLLDVSSVGGGDQDIRWYLDAAGVGALLKVARASLLGQALLVGAALESSTWQDRSGERYTTWVLVSSRPPVPRL